MKRYVIFAVLVSVSILVGLAILEANSATPSKADYCNPLIKVQAENEEVLNAIHSVALPVPLTSCAMKIAPVLDSTGAVVSDPSGMFLTKISPGEWLYNHKMDRKIAPVFDSNGEILSDPTGTIMH